MRKNGISIAARRQNCIVKALAAAVAVFISLGYLATVYFPELELKWVALSAVAFAAVFSIPVCFGKHTAYGFASYAALALIAYFVTDTENGSRDFLAMLGTKLERILTEIRNYIPDYTVDYGFDCHALLVLFFAAISGLFAFVFVRCFFLKKNGAALMLVAVCTALSLLGYERMDTPFLLLSAALIVTIVTAKSGFLMMKRGTARFIALALALSIAVGALYTSRGSLYNRFDSLAHTLGLDGLEAWIYGTDTDDGETFSPGEFDGEFCTVGMNDIEYKNKPVYVATVRDYSGAVYLTTASYYDFDSLDWTNYTTLMLFAPSSSLVEARSRCQLVRVSGNGSLPNLVWSKNRTDSNVGELNQYYRADAYIPFSPTDREYFNRLDAAAKSGLRLPDMNVSQYSNSDVDMAALASEVTARYTESRFYTKGESELKTALNAVALFLSGKKYNMTPTASDAYVRYDPNHSPLYNFIYVTNEGYCVHFATAAALLLREMGFVTRYSIGYCITAVDGSDVNVLDSNSHAWAEIYIDTVGWLPVEMTVGMSGMSFATSGGNTSDAESSDASDESDDASEPSRDDESGEASNVNQSLTPTVSGNSSESSDNTEGGTPFNVAGAVIVLSLLAVAAVAVMIYRRCVKLGERIRNAGSADDVRAVEAVRYCWRFVIGLFGVLGIDVGKYGDLRDLAAEIESGYDDLPPLAPVLDMFLSAEFGNTADSTAAAECAEYALLLNAAVKKKIGFFTRLKAYAVGKTAK